MNKYALIISAMAVFGGVSNVFSQDKFSSVKEFCNDMVKEHPKKLRVAGVITGYKMVWNCLVWTSRCGGDPMGILPRANLLWYNWDPHNWEANVKGCRSGLPVPTLSAGIVVYSALKTAYDRSAK